MPDSGDLPSGLGPTPVQFGKPMLEYFCLDPNHHNLNHGALGTYPAAVARRRQALLAEIERAPDLFVVSRYNPLLDESRAALAGLLNAPVEEIVIVPNATTGINTVLRSLVYVPGDVIIYFSTVHIACKDTIGYICETTPVEKREIPVTFPEEDEELVKRFVDTIKDEKSKGRRVKIAVFETVVSLPGVRLPFEHLTEVCQNEGVMSLVDAAHGIGHLHIDLRMLNSDFFISNCYKWLYVPRGCAVLHVPIRNQHLIRSTLPTSYGFIPADRVVANSPPPSSGKSDFVVSFEYVGTIDTSNYFCIPTAIKWRSEIAGGEAKIIEYCHSLARMGGQRAANMLGTEIMDNSTHTLTQCCMVNVRLPIRVLDSAAAEIDSKEIDVQESDVAALQSWLGRRLITEFNTRIPVIYHGRKLWVRFSAQTYLEMTDFEWAADVLMGLCERAREKEYLQPDN